MIYSDVNVMGPVSEINQRGILVGESYAYRIPHQNNNNFFIPVLNGEEGSLTYVGEPGTLQEIFGSTLPGGLSQDDSTAIRVYHPDTNSFEVGWFCWNADPTWADWSGFWLANDYSKSTMILEPGDAIVFRNNGQSNDLVVSVSVANELRNVPYTVNSLWDNQTKKFAGQFIFDAPPQENDSVRSLASNATFTFSNNSWTTDQITGNTGNTGNTEKMNQLPNIIPQYPDHNAATAEHLAFWQGSADGNKSLPLKPGLSYYNTTDKRVYRSVQAATAAESWIDANAYEALAGRVEGFISDLKSYLNVSGDALTISSDATGTTVGLDETKINAGLLNGHTAQQIVEMSRQRQRVHNVDSVLDPRDEPIPSVVGATWVTSHAGNGLSALTVYRLAASGAHQVVENLIPGDYVLAENGEGADVAYITKTIDGVVTLAPVGEDELTPPELKLVQILTLFGVDRIIGLLESVEEFGPENWRTEQQITDIATAKAAAVQALLQTLIDFGPSTAVQLLTALQTFGPKNLIKISDVHDFYLVRNIKINFDPTVGSADPASAWYQRPYEAPLDNMTVNAIPDGYKAGFVFKNFDLVGPATAWFRTS